MRRMAGTGRHKPMTHKQVIENFVKEGKGGKGTLVKADDKLLYSRIPVNYRPYGQEPWGETAAGQEAPLAARLEDDSLLVNGARFARPIDNHQWVLLNTLEHADTQSRYSVVPFHSIVAAWTDGEVDDWNRSPIPIWRLRKEVGVVVPSTGERWRKVTVKDSRGRDEERTIHTLGDSVVRVKDRFYVSAVDETGVDSGMYFFAELQTERPPASLEEALTLLKPKVVQEAEARGANVLRQGEWFAVPVKITTSELMRDVERGIAVWQQGHILGRDGHHMLEEAVIYRAGPRKGEVYARGVVRHTREEHMDLHLRGLWHLIVHNIQGASYTLSGRGTAQFD